MGVSFVESKTFTITGIIFLKKYKIIDVQKKTLADIHKAIEEGKQSASSPLTGIATVCCLDNILSAGGILSSPDEIASFTLGSPYRSVCICGEEEQPKACTQARITVAYNALKLNEVSSNELVASFKKFMENPEFLLE